MGFCSTDSHLGNGASFRLVVNSLTYLLRLMMAVWFHPLENFLLRLIMNSSLKILSIACIMSLVACKPAADSRSVDGSNESPGTSSAPVANAEPTTAAPAPAESAAPANPAPAPAENTEPAKPTTPVADKNTLTFDGLGDIRYGMSKDAFLALKLRTHGPSDMMDGPDSCHFYPLAPAGDTHVMIEKKRVTRIDAGPSLGNALGVKVGDPIAGFLAKYPKAVVGPHKYVPGAKEVTLWNDARNAAFVLETDAKGNITHVRSGISPNVQYVEGCA